MRFDLKILRNGSLASCAAALLAACTFGGEAEPAGELVAEGQPANAGREPAVDDDISLQSLPLEPIEMAETAWAANDNDGAIYTTFIDPDGAYRDFRDGRPHQIGSWDMPGENRLCFQPDNAPQGDAGRTCWTVRPPGEDGAMIAIGKDSMRVTIRQIEYVAPGTE